MFRRRDPAGRRPSSSGCRDDLVHQLHNLGARFRDGRKNPNRDAATVPDSQEQQIGVNASTRCRCGKNVVERNGDGRSALRKSRTLRQRGKYQPGQLDFTARACPRIPCRSI
jgi:hypothetical protein